jgi:hypothetical protein
MSDTSPAKSLSQANRKKTLAVRFPLREKRQDWKDLLPRRWRRRVVIQGEQFVL